MVFFFMCNVNQRLKHVIVDSNAMCIVNDDHGHVGHVISKMTGQELQNSIQNTDSPPQLDKNTALLQEMHHKKQLPPTWHVQTAVCVCVPCAVSRCKVQGAKVQGGVW